MRIEIVGGEQRFAGTPRQILMQMKSLAPGSEHMTLRDYLESNLARIARGSGVALTVSGETDEELAESFLRQMLEAGYARRL